MYDFVEIRGRESFYMNPEGFTKSGATHKRLERVENNSTYADGRSTDPQLDLARAKRENMHL